MGRHHPSDISFGCFEVAAPPSAQRQPHSDVETIPKGDWDQRFNVSHGHMGGSSVDHYRCGLMQRRVIAKGLLRMVERGCTLPFEQLGDSEAAPSTRPVWVCVVCFPKLLDGLRQFAKGYVGKADTA